MFFNLLVAAGSETTRNSIAGGLLGVHGPTRSSGSGCRPTATLLPTAVEEMLRWTSSTTYNRRTATRDAELGGQSDRAPATR